MRLFLLLGFVLFSALLGASQVIAEKLEVMSQKSDVVAHAKVVEQHTEQSSEGRIVTLSTLQIIDPISDVKGAKTITLYQVGGTYHGRTMRVEGASHFSLGEEVVFFGSSLNEPGIYVPYGLGYGKFRVMREGTRARVIEELGDMRVFEHRPGQSLRTAKARSFDSLDAFKAIISWSRNDTPSSTGPAFKQYARGEK